MFSHKKAAHCPAQHSFSRADLGASRTTQPTRPSYSTFGILNLACRRSVKEDSSRCYHSEGLNAPWIHIFRVSARVLGITITFSGSYRDGFCTKESLNLLSAARAVTFRSSVFPAAATAAGETAGTQALAGGAAASLMGATTTGAANVTAATEGGLGYRTP